jgi:glycosyltransferase involved in cell wall biosynthesis
VAPAVHQFVPALIPRDATGVHTLLLRDALRASGWRSEIYAEATHDELIGESIPFERYPAQATPDDVLIYQCSTSSAVADFLMERSERLIIDYHNLTDPALLAEWDQESAERSAAARRQLGALAPRAVFGMADSHWNEVDLQQMGCERTCVVPVLVDIDRVNADPDPAVAARLAEARAAGGPVWLFVGRVVPSKAPHDLVKALWTYRQLYHPQARLHLVGGTPAGAYLSSLRTFIATLGLEEQVWITGEVSDAGLAAHLAAADVYVSLSVHEGFGVPLLEANRAGIPVIALAAGAVPETLGDAGILLQDSSPLAVAAAVDRVTRDAEVRDLLVAAGLRRASEESLERNTRLAVDAVSSVVGPAPNLTGVRS